MENKLTAKQAIGSLVFPALVLIAAISFFCGFTVYLGDLRLDYNFQHAFQIIAGLGGVLPIILTLVLKADTSAYLLRRLVFLFASIGLLALFATFLGDEAAAFPLFCAALVLTVVVPAVYFAIKCRNTKEWVVVFLSNPTLWLGIWIIAFAIDISQNPFLAYFAF